MSIAVLGSGVIGLSTAISLREKGYDANIYTVSDESSELASHAACALWMPFLMCDDDTSESQELDSKYWAEESWAKFTQLFELREETGIFKVRHDEAWRVKPKIPYYKDIVDNFIEKPISFSDFTYKWEMTTYVIDMSLYMGWLREKYSKLGGSVVKINIAPSVEELRIREPVIFNCTGMGSNTLFNDNTLEPVKGLLLLYKKGQTDCSFGDNEYCIIPRKNNLIIGSLLLPESDKSIDINNINYLKEKTTRLIENGLDKKYGVNSINNQECEIITGIRPYRKNGVRIGLSELNNKSFYHNYGHGGSGVTFSWGCVSDCIKLFERSATDKIKKLNKIRSTDVVDVSIEIAHVELDIATGQIEGVAFEIIDKSIKIAKEIKSSLLNKNYSFNTVVLIDDKKYSKSNSYKKESVIKKLLTRLKQIGVDYIIFESDLESYAPILKSMVHKNYRRDFDIYRRHSSTGCTEDIIIWYALRLGIINYKKSLFKDSSKYNQHKTAPFTADRIISILPSSLTSVENRAERRITKSFGNDIGALCGKVYFELSK